MPDPLIKTTPLGLISIEIRIDGDAPTVPTSEVRDLIVLLRETANNLQATLNYCAGQEPHLMSVSLKVH